MEPNNMQLRSTSVSGQVNTNAQAFCARDAETIEEPGVYGINPKDDTRRDKTGDGACGDVMGREKLFTAVIVGFVAGLNMEKAMEI